MNVETGEIRKVEELEQVGVDEVGISVGEIVELKGVACKVTAINEGKRRISLTTMPRKRAAAEQAITNRIKVERAKAKEDAIRRKVQVGQ